MVIQCSFVGCLKKTKARGMCSAHYESWRRQSHPELNEFKKRWVSGEGVRESCQVPECESDVLCQGLCRSHYSSFHYESTRGKTVSRKHLKRSVDGVLINPFCEFPGCGRDFHKAGLCSPHYSQKLKGRKLSEIISSRECSIPWCKSEYSTSRSRYPFCKIHVDTRRRFNMTSEQLITVVSPGVCQNPGCDETENLFIDHDHSCCKVGVNATTSRVSCGFCVRGLLCNLCNSGLGMLQENPQKIRGLLEYIDRFKN